MNMKIRFLRTILVDVYKSHMEEVWDKQFNKWDELLVESINYYNKGACIYTFDGDVLQDVAIDSFEVI